MPMYYAIPLGVICVFFSYLMLRSGRTLNHIWSAAILCIFCMVLVQFDTSALSKATIGPLKIEQNLQKSQQLRDETEKLKFAVDSTAARVIALTADLDTTVADLREVTKLNAELSILQIQTRNILGVIKEPVRTMINDDLEILTRFAEPDSSHYMKWLLKLDSAIVKSSGQSIFPSK